MHPTWIRPIQIDVTTNVLKSDRSGSWDVETAYFCWHHDFCINRACAVYSFLNRTSTYIFNFHFEPFVLGALEVPFGYFLIHVAGPKRLTVSEEHNSSRPTCTVCQDNADSIATCMVFAYVVSNKINIHSLIASICTAPFKGVYSKALPIPARPSKIILSWERNKKADLRRLSINNEQVYVIE